MSIPSLQTDPGDAVFLNDDCVPGTNLPNVVKSTFLSHRKPTTERATLVWQAKLEDHLIKSKDWVAVITAWTLRSVHLALPLPTCIALFVQVLWAQFQGHHSQAELLLNQAQLLPAEETSLFSEQNETDHPAQGIDNEAPLAIQCQIWTLNLGAFFEVDGFVSLSKESDKLANAVSALREMRQLSKSTLESDSWRQAFKATGLCRVVQAIINPHTREEIWAPYQQASYQSYNWRSFLGESHYKSTPPEHRIAAPSPPDGCARIDVHEFLTAASDPGFTTSMRHHCQQIFFASSEANWLFEWHRWILPTLTSMRLKWHTCPDQWDIKHLWRQLCRVDFNRKLLENPGAGWEDLNFVLLQCQLAREHTQFVKRLWSRRPKQSRPSVPPVPPTDAQGGKVPRPPKIRQLPYSDPTPATCSKCSDKPAELQCVRKLYQPRRSPTELELWEQSILTCACPGDRFTTDLPDKVVLDPGPDGLNFEKISFRPSVYLDCGRDITIIHCAETKKKVGGVEFLPWDTETLAEMRASHTLVGKYANKQQRSKKTQKTGDIRTTGSRMSKGGAPGDGYRPYAHHTGTHDGMEALFAHGRDSDTMTETVRAFAPEVIRDIRSKTQQAGLNRMGKTGMNSFYCWEYGSPLHRDRDIGWSLCCQLWKSAASDEYNFAYAEWGVYIETIENCVWFFNPGELHGTVLPRLSSLPSAISRGTHTTIRQVDFRKASLYEEVRLSYDARVAFWAAY